MKQNLEIALLQSRLCWLDPDANRTHYGELIANCRDADIALLPEVFTTGFDGNARDCAETMDGDTVAWLKATSQQFQIAVCGSIIIENEGKFFNRMLFAHPDGQLDHYDKRHLFRMAGEHKRYAGGDSQTIVHYQGWRIALMVCYDLRFPVWCRNQGDYDALLFVANWPSPRRMHWRQLLIARAIENQAFVAGTNRIGSDANGLDYSGDSLLINPQGEILVDAADGDGVFRGNCQWQNLQDYRERFPCHLDADRFTIET